MQPTNGLVPYSKDQVTSFQNSRRHTSKTSSGYIAARILKEPNFELTQLHKGFPKGKQQYVLGFDTEAENGEPFLLQIAHPDGEVHVFDVDASTILDVFLHHIEESSRDRRKTYVVYGFHLAYEFTQLFQCLPRASWGYGEIVADGGWYQLLIYNEKRFTFIIKFPGRQGIRVLDAMAFIPTSLARAAEVIGVGQKHDKPEVFTRAQRDDPTFLEYARQDAILTQRLGEYVVDLHRTMDVPQSLSASHFAAQVFRRRYMRDSIARPSEELEQLGLECYHGGKNAYYRSEPAEYDTAYAYDIRSAYSEAMAQLPDVESGLWTPTEELTPHSIVRARVAYHGCTFRPLWHTDHPTTTWISTTGYELISALECGSIELLELAGHRLDGEQYGSLWRYVMDFYEMKRGAKTGGEKVAAKLFLNGLYGKFFQKVPLGSAATFNLTNGQYQIHDWTQPYDYIAGGLYHPPIASLITGFVRAKIHRLEHRYRAIMTSTDGIFATQSPLASDVGEDLGQLEAITGRLRVWRERLYIFEPANGAPAKVALHGFRGRRADLEQIPLQKGTFAYDATTTITLRMAQTNAYNKYRPGQFVQLPYHVTN